MSCLEIRGSTKQRRSAKDFYQCLPPEYMCFQLHFQLMSVVETLREARMTNAQIEKCHQSFRTEFHKAWNQSHYFEALGSSAKQEWPLLRMVAEPQ